MSKYFKFRKEELPEIAGFIKHSYKRDKAQFENFSPDFNVEYLDRLEKQTEKVNLLVNPVILIAEQKKVTSRLYENMDKVRHILERVQAYAQRSNKELTMSYKDFGCKQARDDARRRHVDGLLHWITEVEQNIANNKEALKSHGLKDKYLSQLTELRDKIKEDHLLKTAKRKEKEELVAKNMIEFDTLWTILHDISRTGRMLFKNEDEVKMREYMFTHLLNRVRSKDQKKEDKKKRKKVQPQTEEKLEEQEQSKS